MFHFNFFIKQTTNPFIFLLLKGNTPSPWLTRFRFTRISLTCIFKKFPFLTNTYYEAEIPSLTQIYLHVVLTNLVNTNFA